MPGSITTGATSPAHIGQSPSYVYDVELTIDASGNLSGVPIAVHPGYITAMDTIPDASSPPASGYTVKLLNDFGVDVLAGVGASRSRTESQRAQPRPSPVRGSLWPTISGGGAGAKIRMMLYLQGA